MHKSKIDRNIEKYGEDLIRKKFNESKSKTEFLEKLGFNYTNGSTSRFVNECIRRFNLSEDHFDTHWKQRIYEEIIKECPICGKEFKTKKNHDREKMTCSYSCSNTYFRSGQNNG